MNRRLTGTLFMAALVAASAGALHAGDDPHGLTYIGRLNQGGSGVSGSCNVCHATHKAAGASLTNAISNESLCASCHTSTGLGLNFPIDAFVKADPQNRLGSSHAWNTPAENAAAGASVPAGTVFADHLSDGNVTCSTCHDQHGTPGGAIAAGLAGSQTKANAIRVAGSGSGTVSYTATATAAAKAYLIEIIDAGAAGTATFRLSNDGGVSWFGWSSGAWTTYAAGTARLTGSNVALNDGANVVATFSNDFVAGDRIRFYVGYPFLRASLDSGDNATGSKFCRACHAGMAMDHGGVNTWDGSMKSHPVGIPLNANGLGSDRAAPLDADGSAQSGAGDGNRKNDLQLAPDSTVQCLTCHGVHHADGNSNTAGAQ